MARGQAREKKKIRSGPNCTSCTESGLARGVCCISITPSKLPCLSARDREEELLTSGQGHDGSKLYGGSSGGERENPRAAVMSLACVKCRLAIRQRFSLGTFFPLLSERLGVWEDFFARTFAPITEAPMCGELLRHPRPLACAQAANPATQAWQVPRLAGRLHIPTCRFEHTM